MSEQNPTMAKRCAATTRDVQKGDVIGCCLPFGHIGEHQNTSRLICWPSTSTIDEPWISDVQALTCFVNVNSMDLAAEACERQFNFCYLCGELFPLWPPKALMGHIAKSHADDLTVQQVASCAALCSDKWDERTANYFVIQLITRVAVRRRCRDLGLFEFPEAETPKNGSGLLGPDGRRVQ